MAVAPGGDSPGGVWPELRLEEWRDSYATVHLWTQMLGKTRLALSPPVNHWWHSALYVSPRGLTTSAMPCESDTLDIELDFLTDRLIARRSNGAEGKMTLRSCPIAEFYAEYRELLGSLGVDARIWAMPVEIEGAIPFSEDHQHGTYDAEAVQRCWRMMAAAQQVLQRFRGEFLGKSSPAHFWWGAFDLACTRFSGRLAPPHPGGVPNLADRVIREAYSHECMSAGWWPGSIGGPLKEAAFYGYFYPEPPGFSELRVETPGAYYHPDLREWVLPWDAVRGDDDSAGMAGRFFTALYSAGADLAGWDRRALERTPSP